MVGIIFCLQAIFFSIIELISERKNKKVECFVHVKHDLTFDAQKISLLF